MPEDMPPVTHEGYRRLALFDMPDEIKLGMNLAFYRTFGIPAIAELLAATGEITGRTLKRADDTGLIMYLLIYYGFEHPQGQAVLARLNRMHHRHKIANADYLYVLASIAVIPTRLIARHGQRALTGPEKAATHGFYGELGERMGVADIPGSYPELERFLDGYEREHMRFSPAGAQLMQASGQILAERFPGWLGPLATQWVGALLDSPLRQALGVAKPGRLARLTLAMMLRARFAHAKRRNRTGPPAFHPAAPVRSYPHGYTVDQLGPSEL